jgi:hypothetical protein
MEKQDIYDAEEYIKGKLEKIFYELDSIKQEFNICEEPYFKNVLKEKEEKLENDKKNLEIALISLNLLKKK